MRRPTHDKHGRPLPRKTIPKLKEKDSKRNYKTIAGEGPIKHRNCTDCLCCIFFYAYVAFHIVTFAYAFKDGNPYLLAQPFDVDNNACGANNTATQDYPFAYWISPFSSFGEVICIKKCPSWTVNETAPSTIGDCYIGGPQAAFLTGRNNNVTKKQNCDNVFAIDLNNPGSTILANIQTIYNTTKVINLFNTTELLGSFCVPYSVNATDQFKANYQKFLSSTANSSIVENYLSDIYATWQVILGSAGFAFIVSLVYMVILYCCVGVLIWLTILLFFVIMVGAAVLLHIKANQYNDDYQATKNENYLTSYRKFFYTALFVDALTFFMFCAVCCYFKTIELTIAVLKSAALFVQQNMLVVFVPVLTALVQLIYLFIWVFGILFLWSIGTYTKRNNYPIGQVQWTNQQYALVYSFIFGMLWIGCAMLYIGQFLIIMATTIWYFDHNKDKTLHPFPLLTAAWWTFRYHTGSVAFGAFILALVLAAKIIVTYVQWQVERAISKDQSPGIIKNFFNCLQALLVCLERVVKVINKTGFIVVALKSQYFCLSCLEGMTLILRNPMKFGMISVFGQVFIFIGKAFIGAVTATAGYNVITRVDTYSSQINSPFVPTLIFFVNGVVVGSIFMSVYGLSADTIMFCYFVENEGPDNIKGKNCPPPMKAFFAKYKTDTPSEEEDEEPYK